MSTVTSSARIRRRIAALPLAAALMAAAPAPLYPGCDGILGTLFAGGYSAARKQVGSSLDGLEKELQGNPAAREEAIRSRLREIVPLVARLAPQSPEASPESQCRLAGILHGAQFSLAEAKRKQPKICNLAAKRYGTNGATMLCTLQRGRPAILESVHPQAGWDEAICGAPFRAECEAAFKARMMEDCSAEALASDAARLNSHAQSFCSALK